MSDGTHQPEHDEVDEIDEMVERIRALPPEQQAQVLAVLDEVEDADR